jgi:hypothetical protein
MSKKIDISKYQDYFHDGSLFNILKSNNKITFEMSSAEIDPSEIEGDLIFSTDNRIRGILHLENINNIHITGNYKLENLFDVFNLGTILDFEIIDKTVDLGILWENCLPKLRTNEFTTIAIEAERIWWENMPDLQTHS